MMPKTAHRPLDPILARIVEALADHMVDQDIRRLRVGLHPAARIAAKASVSAA